MSALCFKLLSHSLKAFYALLNVICRFCNSLLYYGLGLNAGSLAGSIYVTVFLGKKCCIKLILLEFSVTYANFHSYSGGAVEIPAVLVSIWAMFYFGRRPTLAWGFIAAAAFNFLCIPFINNSGQPPPQCNKTILLTIIIQQYNKFSCRLGIPRHNLCKFGKSMHQTHLLCRVRLHSWAIPNSSAPPGGGKLKYDVAFWRTYRAFHGTSSRKKSHVTLP